METEDRITHINIDYVREMPEEKYSWETYNHMGCDWWGIQKAALQ